ncbi:MAG: DUF72 domain-containing protein [Deltaproteobacteria bacterium]|nr:DUF72 domain-containing protein [Deltaproteobacteria bacterium]
MTARILIGTSGYAYADWVGPVYPRGTRPDEYLRVYSKLFSTCELNFSHYVIPTAKTLSTMVERTEGRMQFAVKVHRSITHERPADLAVAVHDVREPLEPLREAGVLAAVLLQFPQSFHRERDNRVYLGALVELFRPDPLVVELRHRSWEHPRVFEQMRENDVALCALDVPDLPGLFRPPAVVTSSLGYVRFHGRNAADWYSGESPHARYEHSYSKEELVPWIGRLRTMASQVDTLLVYFNNHPRGHAVESAKLLEAMLAEG